MTNDSHADAQDGRQAGPRRTWWIGLGVLAAAALAIAIVVLLAPDEAPVSGFTETEEQPLFRGLENRLGEVESIQIESSGQHVTLRRGESDWLLVQQHGYPVRRERVEDLLQGFVALRARHVSEGDARSNAESVVDRPEESSSQAVRVRLLDTNGNVMAGAILGHSFTVPAAQAQTKMLVRREEDDQVWLAEPVIRVEASPRAWLNRQIVDVPRGEVMEVVALLPENERLVVRQSDDRDVTLAEGPSGADAGEPVLAAAISALEKVEFLDVQPASEIAEAAERAEQLIVTTKEGIVYRIRLRTLEGEDWALFSADTAGNGQGNGQAGGDDAAARAARFDDEHGEWAYRLPVHVVASLKISPEDLTDELPSGEAPADAPKRDAGRDPVGAK